MGGEAKRKMLYQKSIADAIARWKEVNLLMELKIIFVGNATLVGEYEDKILRKPRAISVGADPHGRTVIGMQLLVGEPESVEIINPSIMFDVKDEKIVNLYIQATTGIVPATNLSNVRPIKGGPN